MGVDFVKAALAAGHAVVASGRDRDGVARALGPSDDPRPETINRSRLVTPAITVAKEVFQNNN